MDYRAIIESTIRLLERIREESPEFQHDALWKLGDILGETLDYEASFDEEVVWQQLHAFHQQVGQMIEPDISEAKEREDACGPDLPSEY